MVARFPLIIIIILYPYEKRPGGLGGGKGLALLLMLLFPPSLFARLRQSAKRGSVGLEPYV